MAEAPKNGNGRHIDKGMWLGGEPKWHAEWRTREGSALEKAISNAEMFGRPPGPLNGMRREAGLPELSTEEFAARRRAIFGPK